MDAPRWQIMEGLKVRVEAGFKKNTIETLIQKGHNVSEGHFMQFGGSQLIYKLEDGYLGASDPRKDGQAVGF